MPDSVMNGTAPLKEPFLSEEIYATLKQRLMLGGYLPGDRLSMRKLAVEFGTSPMPVREALKRLASEHVIESAAAKAFNVPSLSGKRAGDLFELRAILEGRAVEMVHASITPELLNELDGLCDRMDAHFKLRDFAAYMVDNHRFHFLLYRLTDNSDLVAMIEQLWMKTGPSLSQGLLESKVVNPDWNADHRRLCAAIEEGRVSDLGTIMRADIEWGADFYRA